MAGADEEWYVLVFSPNILKNGAAVVLLIIELYLNQAYIIPLLHCLTLWTYCVYKCVCEHIVVRMYAHIYVHIYVCLHHVFILTAFKGRSLVVGIDLSRAAVNMYLFQTWGLRLRHSTCPLVPWDWLWWVITGAPDVIHSRSLCANSWIQQMATLFL